MAPVNAAGFAYVEVLVAAVMVALLAMPAADAIRNGIDASRVSQAKAAELRCVRNRMETVLAEPYLNLNLAAGTTAYNLAADAHCGNRTVVIARKLFDGANLADLAPGAGEEQLNTALLTVKVSMDTSDYTFSTVVAR
jgi:type II secretory pathway pseudopilin PulG